MDYIQLLRIMLDDTTQEDLARELNTTQATISRWLSGQEPRGSAIDRIRRLARSRRLAGASYNSSLDGEDELFAEGAISQSINDSSDTNRNRSKRSRQNNPDNSGDIANFTIHAGMGNGGTVSVQVNEDGEAIDPSDSDGYWSFPDQVKAGWRQMNQTYAMPVTGDSMEPTLTNGSYVFVDTSHKYPSPPDLYAVDYGHGLMIKRLELLPEDKVRVISDNERYTDFDFHASDVEVYGRVVASFQWRG